MWYANGGYNLLLPICDGISKFFINSRAFGFAMILAWIDPLAAFVFAFALTPLEALQCACMLFQLLLHSHTAYKLYGILAPPLGMIFSTCL